MLKVIQEKFSKRILFDLASRYDADNESITFCGGYESAVYSFRNNNHEYILKITLGKVKDIREVEAELEFVNYLYNKGFSVSNAICSHNGELIETEKCDDDFFYARCYAKASGVYISNMCNMSLLNRWGQTMGRLHKLSKQFVPSDGFYCKQWYENPRLKNKHWDREVIERVEEVTNHIGSLKSNKENYGITHNDLHQENFFINNGRLTVIDFDDLGYSWFMYDIAVVLYQVIYRNVFAQQDPDFNRRFFHTFIEGYSKENRIDDDLMLELPYFLQLRHIILYSAYCEDVDFQHIQKYEERLLLKFHRDICNRKNLIDFEKLFK